MNKRLLLLTIIYISLFGLSFTGSGWWPVECSKSNILTDSLTEKLNVSLFSSPDKEIEEKLSKMSVEEKIGQIIFPAIKPDDFFNPYKVEKSRIDDITAKFHPGGFLLLPGTHENIVKITSQFQSSTSIPYLFCSDMESGVGFNRHDSVSFPPLMAWGATDDSVLTYRASRLIARQGRALGIHVNFSPVADINSDENNGVINLSSFSDFPELVSRQVTAFIRGTQDGGMI